MFKGSQNILPVSRAEVKFRQMWKTCPMLWKTLCGEMQYSAFPGFRFMEAALKMTFFMKECRRWRTL